MAAAQGKKAETKFQKSYFDVLGLCCTSEVPLVERILKNLDGVKDFSVIVPSRTVIVIHDSLLISQLQIVKALNQARLEASLRVQGVKNFKKKWPSPYSIACGVLLLLSFLHYIWHPLQWLAVSAVAIGIIPIVLRAFIALRNLKFGDINLLVLIAVAGSIVLKDYWEAGTIVFLFTIAEWLESRASHKATAAMSSLVNLVPQRAILAETGEEVNVDEVKVNTVLAVKDGEVVPIDGIVIEGNCEVDEKTLTGESFPVPKQKDSTVWAGTINVNGYISIKTTALAEDSVVARMTKLVEEAQNKRSRTQRYIDKCAQYYTPAIVIISTGLAVVPASLKVHNKKYWYHLALVVLVSACPCALVLSTPVAMFCALTKAAAAGVFFKGAEYLETLAEVKIMAFDKTGTITRAEFEVTEFRPLLDDINLNTLLYWVSSIESKSSHPLAAALIDFAQLNSVEPKPDKVEQFQNFPGEGIYGKMDGKDIYIGNKKIASRSGCASVPNLEGNVAEGKSVGYIFLESRPAGIFCLSDVCRTGAKEALQELKSMGIKTALLTGDSSAAAIQAQDQLLGALEEVHAELLPEDKVRMIKDFQKEACTAMIGDGVNDAPALSTADIGISMGISGSALATETGNILLMTNDIRRIPKVARLARRVKRKIIENMFLSIITKAAIVALAIAGHPLVWAAVLADTGTCLLVIFNSMFLLRGMTKDGSKCCKTSAVPLHRHEDRVNEPAHTHQSCCTDTKPRKTCVVQTCSSKNCAPRCQTSKTSSGGAHKHQVHRHQDFNDKHSCCGQGNQLQESKDSSGAQKHEVHKHQDSRDKHGCCGQSNQFHESKDSSGAQKHEGHKHQHSRDKHSCCGQGNQLNEIKHLNLASCNNDICDIGSDKHHHREINCSNPSKRNTDCVVDAGEHEIMQSHHDDHKTTACNVSPSRSSAISPSTSGKQFQVKSCPNNTNSLPISDEEMGDVAQSCGQSHPANTVHSECKNHAAECGVEHHSIMKCPNLDNRQVGRCCQSFRKECCTKNSPFGANFRGGLSEIVIE